MRAPNPGWRLQDREGLRSLQGSPQRGINYSGNYSDFTGENPTDPPEPYGPNVSPRSSYALTPDVMASGNRALRR